VRQAGHLQGTYQVARSTKYTEHSFSFFGLKKYIGYVYYFFKLYSSTLSHRPECFRLIGQGN